MGTLHEDQYTFFITYRSFFLEWEMFQTKVWRKSNIHFMFNNVFRKSCHLLDEVKKYCTAGQATDGNTAQEHFILDT
jgi:hypothetical protein